MEGMRMERVRVILKMTVWFSIKKLTRDAALPPFIFYPGALIKIGPYIHEVAKVEYDCNTNDTTLTLASGDPRHGYNQKNPMKGYAEYGWEQEESEKENG